MNWLSRMGLRWQVAVGVAIIFIFLFGIFAYVFSGAIQQTTEVVKRERLNLATSTANSIDALIDHTIDQLGSVAALEEFQSETAPLEAKRAAMETVLHTLGTFSTMGLLDERNRVVLVVPGDSEDLILDTDLSAYPFIQRARQGMPSVGRTEHLAPDHPPLAIVAIPLKDPPGRIQGILLGVLHLSHMGLELVPLPVGSRYFSTQVIDGQGNILVSSIGEHVVGTDLHLPLLRPLIRDGVAGVMTHDPDLGPGHIVAYAPLRTVAGGVIVEEERGEALSVPLQMRRTMLAFGFLALAAVSLGAWMHARYVLRPIVALEEATRSIASGALGRPVITSRGGEIGGLAKSFEAMRVQLKAAEDERLLWQRDLEIQVRKRTQEVHSLVGRILSAQEEERRRLARELHDDTAQTLASLLVSFQAVHDALPQKLTRERELLARALSQGAQTLTDIRRLILSLRPSALDDLGFVPALRSYAEDRLSPGIKLHFETLGEEQRLEAPVETALFRILQEAVTNVAKHAGARNVHIRLEFQEAAVIGVVRDDGSGFEVDGTLSQPLDVHLGLQGMRERADLVGARLSLSSHPGKGTEVRVEVPMNEGVESA
ncbi:MAG: histidine kinase [Dehalococcoidia bacterium]